MKTLLTILAVMTIAGSAFAQTQIFFSEYIEGSSNNKAVEIYNNTNQPIDLSRVSVERYNNGSTTLGYGATLSGVLAAGDVWVIANSAASAGILAVADDVVNSVFTFYNGDDAILVFLDGILEDSIGQVGFDPGSEWGTGDASTADNTLVRKINDCTGDTDASDAYDPSVSFDGYPIDTISDLGSHTNNCTVVSAEAASWGAVKTLYR